MSTGDEPENPDEERKDPSEAYFQEIERIQAIIERQADNSFKIKGWTITLVVAVIVFRTGDYQTLLGYIPLVTFWYLDSYYLKQERKYRKLYAWVRSERLSSDEHFFEMDASRFNSSTAKTSEIMQSRIQLLFYGVIALLLLIVFIVSILTTGDDVNILSHAMNSSGGS